MYLNARSLTNKMPLLLQYASKNNPKIVAVTETWARREIPDGIYNMPGYKILRADREDKRGGGVMLYVQEGVGFSEISLNRFSDFEYVCCTLNLANDRQLGVLCIYRPPNITDVGDSNLIKVLEAFLNHKFHLNIIVGDFNMPQVDWKKFSGPSKYTSFIDCCLNYFLIQHIHESTRPTSNSRLDLLFSTLGTKVQNVTLNECFGSSDHSLLNFIIDLPCLWKTTHLTKPRRNYNKANWDIMYDHLSNVDWNTIFHPYQENIDDMWEMFKSCLSQAVNVSIPLKNKKPWRIKSSSKIRSALRFTRRCYAVYRTSKSNESLLRLIHAKDNLQNLIDKQVQSFESYVIKSLRDNPKKYWSYVNSKVTNRRNCLNFVKTEAGNLEDPKQISEALNDYFHKSFNHNANTITYKPTNNDKGMEVLENVSINFETVRRILKELPNKCSEDYDGFSYLILKGGGDILSFQLTRLFSFSFSVGQIPKDWKRSVICPIKKKTNPTTVEDYRPINITSCVCRVFERIIRNAIYTFLKNKNFINESQHGFMPRKSTLTALLPYVDDLSFSVDNGKCVDVAYFDFTKAFDSVRHDYLINKLAKAGIQGCLLTWLIDYFSHRTQIVKVHDCLSSERPVTIVV